jgi:FtsP/CotA-like multicopper oxidase with cupredoxin domain
MQFRVGDCTSKACGKADLSYNPAIGQPLRSGQNSIVRLANASFSATTVKPDVTRVLTLNEIAHDESREAIDPVTGKMIEFPGGPMEILVNNTSYSGDLDDMSNRPDFKSFTTNGSAINVSETPQEGATELWEIVNLTADAHPIHLHLTAFQLLNRQDFNVDAYNADYEAAFGKGPVPLTTDCKVGSFCPSYGPPLVYDGSNPLSNGKLGGNIDIDALATKAANSWKYLAGTATPPKNYEQGWLDTVVVPPGQVTRFVVRWAPMDLPTNTPKSALYYPFDPNANNQFNYVWHCHIIDHEDNEMMRPDVVLLNPQAPVPGQRLLVEGRDY